VSTVGRQCGVVRHQLDKSGCEKQTWENDAGVKTEKGKQETQLKLAVADLTKPEVEIWRRPKKSTF